MDRTDHWRGVVMVAGAGICWGTMAILAKLLFRDRGVDPLVLVAVRAYLATLTLFVILLVADPGQIRIGGRGWMDAALVGVAGLMTNNFLYFQAIALTTVATALLLQYQAPVLVALYAVVVQGQRLSGRLVLALGLAVAGCGLVVRVYDPGALRPDLLGVLAGLGTAVAFAFYILAGRAALARVRPWTLLAHAYLASSLVWLCIVPPWRIAAQGYDATTWLAFVAVATLGTALPFGLFINGLRLLPPTQAGILSMIEPVVATLVAYLVLGETLVPLQVVGGAMVIGAVALAGRTAGA
jgi:drug/metabolite transporter (DMT)-like permease